MKTVAPTPAESMFIQSYAFAESVVNISRIEAKGGADCSLIAPLIFRGPVCAALKSVHGGSIFGGQGSLLACLYLMLTLVYEWNRRGESRFGDIDLTPVEKVVNDLGNGTSNYPSSYGTLRNMRNAITHGRYDWCDQTGAIIFTDEGKLKDGTIRKFRRQFSMGEIEKVMDTLSDVMSFHIKEMTRSVA